MNQSIVFIGGGNMARAMIGGILNSGLAAPSQITATARTPQTCKTLAKEFGIHTSLDNQEAARQADILILAVKPGMFPQVIGELKSCIRTDTLILSIAAGQSLDAIEAMFGAPIKLIRAMPNTPALVGEAMSALCANEHVTQKDLDLAVSIFQSFGKCQVIGESMMDAFIGVSGSSPAYVFLFLEAMADAAVADGIPRDMAYEFAAQSVLGSAKMVLETGLHPGVLKDQVCSPGGTTIEAVAVLEQEGLRQAVIKGQRACVQKSRDMNSR
ncbi:MAG: pyrroline-5-carboxylate reductase [Lachnospiraceae bacterium]|nr:pyrroline-5-carboxylate reductase [Lachnospiraceae bacterium]